MKGIRIYVVVLGLLVFHTSQAQTNTNYLTVRMSGYMMSLGGKVFFQPCEKQVADIYSALDTRSFAIECNPFVDNYCDYILGLGDSVSVDFRKNEMDSPQFSGTVHYFFCDVKMASAIFGADDGDFKVLRGGQLEILHDGKTYPFNANFLRQRVFEVIPASDKIRMTMRKRYEMNQRDVPGWLK